MFTLLNSFADELPIQILTNVGVAFFLFEDKFKAVRNL